MRLLIPLELQHGAKDRWYIHGLDFLGWISCRPWVSRHMGYPRFGRNFLFFNSEHCKMNSTYPPFHYTQCLQCHPSWGTQTSEVCSPSWKLVKGRMTEWFIPKHPYPKIWGYVCLGMRLPGLFSCTGWWYSGGYTALGLVMSRKSTLWGWNLENVARLRETFCTTTMSPSRM